MNLINTGNQIGQSIALTRLIISIIGGCCFCSIGSAVFTMKPKDEKDKPKRTGLIFMGIAVIVILFSYLSYLFTTSFKGAGTAYTAYSAYDFLRGNRK